MSVELFVKSGFAFCGLIHLLPVSGRRDGLVSAAELVRSIGAAVVYKPWRPHAYAAGLCSMSSYLILALSDKWDSLNPFVQRVFWMDVAGLLWLGAAAMVSRGQRPY
eukprot:gene23706-28727_t